MKLKKQGNILQNKKGFTLVEVIVVIVILAILAAILVPSLTSYIDKANDRGLIAEARTMLMGMQTVASERYVSNKSAIVNVFDRTTADGPSNLEDARVLAQLSDTVDVTDVIVDSRGTVQSFTYASSAASSRVVKYDLSASDKFVVTDR